MNKNKSILIVLFVLIVSIFFAGCELEPGEFVTTGIQDDAFSGIKVMYLAQDEEANNLLIAQYEDFAFTTLVNIYGIYGSSVSGSYTLTSSNENSLTCEINEATIVIANVIGNYLELGYTEWNMTASNVSDFASVTNVNSLTTSILRAVLNTTDITKTQLELASSIDHFGFLNLAGENNDETERIITAVLNTVVGASALNNDNDTLNFTTNFANYINAIEVQYTVAPKIYIRDCGFDSYGSLPPLEELPYVGIIYMPKVEVDLLNSSLVFNKLSTGSSIQFDLIYQKAGDIRVSFDIGQVTGTGNVDFNNREITEIDFEDSTLFGDLASGGLNLGVFTNNTTSTSATLATAYSQYFLISQNENGVLSSFEYYDSSTDVLQYKFVANESDNTFEFEEVFADYDY